MAEAKLALKLNGNSGSNSEGLLGYHGNFCHMPSGSPSTP
jgi:hypothetical protein